MSVDWRVACACCVGFEDASHVFAATTLRTRRPEKRRPDTYVTRKPGGVPTMFVGGIGRGQTKVRQRMCQLLESDAAPVLLDDTARRFLAEARKAYLARNLSQDFVIDQGREVLILIWLGCATNEALACLLRSRGLKAAPTGPGTEVHQDGPLTLPLSSGGWASNEGMNCVNWFWSAPRMTDMSASALQDSFDRPSIDARTKTDCKSLSPLNNQIFLCNSRTDPGDSWAAEGLWRKSMLRLIWRQISRLRQGRMSHSPHAGAQKYQKTER